MSFGNFTVTKAWTEVAAAEDSNVWIQAKEIPLEVATNTDGNLAPGAGLSGFTINPGQMYNRDMLGFGAVWVRVPPIHTHSTAKVVVGTF